MSVIYKMGGLIIFCLGIAVYSNTFNCSFHYDDVYVVTNDFVIRNIYDLQNIFQFYPCRFITILSLAVNYHFNGLNVFGYHLFNLAVHLGVSILVWWLTLLTLSTPAMKGNKITQHAGLIALFAGLVFVSHPVQTEGVTYIWQRAASMVALFYLASLCLYVKSRSLQMEDPGSGFGRIYYILSLVMAIVAMFTKENAVTLPLMILLYDFSFFEGKRDLKWRIFFLPFFLTILIIPSTLLLTQAGMTRLEQSHSAHISSIQYLLTQFRVIVTYIRLIFLPLNQNIAYDFPISKSIFELPTLISFLFLAGILYSAIRLFSKYRLLSFCIFWFFLTLSLESGFIPLINIIFEHRLYLPMVGYSIFLVSGVYYGTGLLCRHSDPERSEGEESKGALRSFASLRMTIVVLTMIITFNSILTYERNKVWKNEFTLWDDSVRRSPHKPIPYCYRGLGYYDQGKYTQAISDYNKAIEIDPNYAPAYEGRGTSYASQGNFVRAISDYNKTLEMAPHYINAYYDRAAAYFFMKENFKALTDLHTIEKIGLPIDNERIKRLVRALFNANKGLKPGDHS